MEITKKTKYSNSETNSGFSINSNQDNNIIIDNEEFLNNFLNGSGSKKTKSIKSEFKMDSNGIGSEIHLNPKNILTNKSIYYKTNSCNSSFNEKIKNEVDMEDESLDHSLQDGISAIKRLMKSKNADIYVYQDDIHEEGATLMIQKIRENYAYEDKDFILVLTTNGGDLDAAYRMVRFIKATYNKFTLYVVSRCKSAGTLIALGADEIVMFDHAEFGPLDVQSSKKDELLMKSVLEITTAIDKLKNVTFDMHEEYTSRLFINSHGRYSAKMANELSTNLVSSIMGPVFSKIDLMALGENERAMQIAVEYGMRITDDIEAVEHLVRNYSSHGFVIDFDEARDIFKNVRRPNMHDVLFEMEISLSKPEGEITGYSSMYRLLPIENDEYSQDKIDDIVEDFIESNQT